MPRAGARSFPTIGTPHMSVAIVHEWMTTLGGSERCVEVFGEIWPDAPLYTLVADPATCRRLGFAPERVHTSFLQRLPRPTRWYRNYLPLYPLAVEQFDLTGHDTIVSSSHAAAKGVLTHAEQLHVSYCYSPIRYAWDLTHQYLREGGLTSGARSAMARAILHYIRNWDVATANRVDEFVAISHYIARRIRRVYRRDAAVIYPPVDVERFTAGASKEDYFLFVSRLVPYKRADLVVEVFAKLGLRLLVVGDGPHMDACRRVAGPSVEFLGFQGDEEVTRLMRGARALVFAAEEDFGIVPVEAQACGTPVIAYGVGGATETVVPLAHANFDAATGVYFERQDVESLTGAVREFVAAEGHFRTSVLRANAERFSRTRFRREFSDFVEAARAERFGPRRGATRRALQPPRRVLVGA